MTSRSDPWTRTAFKMGLLPAVGGRDAEQYGAGPRHDACCMPHDRRHARARGRCRRLCRAPQRCLVEILPPRRWMRIGTGSTNSNACTRVHTADSQTDRRPRQPRPDDPDPTPPDPTPSPPTWRPAAKPTGAFSPHHRPPAFEWRGDQHPTPARRTGATRSSWSTWRSSSALTGARWPRGATRRPASAPSSCWRR